MGNLAAIYHLPPEGVEHRAAILYVHPFGHELLNSRPVAAYVWRKLAARGVSVLSIDLPGCGDSEGDFVDARWDSWKRGLLEALEWLQSERGRPLSICGLRLGAALALEIALDEDASSHRPIFDRIILLQPVISGEEMMTQFLRLRVAFSGMRDVPDKRETTQDLRQKLASGQPLDVAGYMLAPELVSAIDRVNLSALRPSPAADTHWLETLPSTDAPVPRVAASVMQAWRAEGSFAQFHSIVVKPYWVHTRGEAPEYENLAEKLTSICCSSGTARAGAGQ